MNLTEQTIRNYFDNNHGKTPGAVLRVRPEDGDTLWSEYGTLAGPWSPGTIVKYRMMRDGGIKTEIESRSHSLAYLTAMYGDQ